MLQNKKQRDQFNKKRSVFEGRLTKSIVKLENLWKALISSGLPNLCFESI